MEANKYEFECKRKTQDGNTETKDKIDFSVKKGARGVVVKIKYEQETEVETPDEEDTDESEATNDEPDDETPDTDGDTSIQLVDDGDERRLQTVEETEQETSYEIAFPRIFEYIPSGDSDAYKEGDEIVQTITLSQWGAFSSVSETTDGSSSTFTVSSMDDMAMFQFTIHRASQGESVSANKMKIDFRLTNFPWARDDSYVALVASVETEREIEVEYDDGSEVAEDLLISFGDAVTEIDGLMPFGELTWATEAEATSNTTAPTTTMDGNQTIMEESTTIEVVATSISTDGNNEEIVFSFIGSGAQSASDIYWDPEAGVNFRSGAPAFVVSFGLLAMTVVALLV